LDKFSCYEDATNDGYFNTDDVATTELYPATALRDRAGKGVLISYRIRQANSWGSVIRLFGLSLMLTLSACSNFGYYAQSVQGQIEILWQRQDITALVENRDTPAELVEKLKLVLRIRDFATEALNLPDNNSYRTYVDLKRPYVVWNVFAAPEFSFDLQQWCFPFAGCVRYRGYFTKESAERFASPWREKGYDTYVGGVAAYSTLGWFNDPVLNTIINRDEPGLAGLIFHELSHQLLYVKDDTAFNEGFAVTVELEGVRRWLQAANSQSMFVQYAAEQHRRQQFIDLVMKTRDRLQALYDTQLSEPDKRAQKTRLLAQFQLEYQDIKHQNWGGYNGYDKWFDNAVNNAKIAAVATYRDYVPAFQSLLRQHQNDLPAFYRATKELGKLTKPEREQKLQYLLLSQ
jgi:predicted aminopeptidase